MLRLIEVASQSETFVKPALKKQTSSEANRLISPPRAKGSKCFLLTGHLYWLFGGGFRQSALKSTKGFGHCMS